MSENIYLDNLCSYVDISNMSINQRREYLHSTIYKGAIPKILAEIDTITKTYMKIKAKYFLMPENRAFEFKMCWDKPLNIISTGKSFNKVDDIEKYCEDNGLNIGDSVIGMLYVTSSEYEISRGNFFTFRIDEFEHAQNLEDIYQVYKLTYEPGKLYALYNNSDERLDIIVCNNINSHIKQILDTGAESIKNQQAQISDLEDEALDTMTLIENLSSEYEKNWQAAQQKLDTEIDNLRRQKLQEFEYDKNNLELEIEALKLVIETQRQDLEYLKKFDILLESPTTEIENYADEDLVDFPFDDFRYDKMLEYWQAYLYHGGEHLYYRLEILDSLWAGLSTNQLILLTGSPGTGKTSLVRNLTKSFGFEDAAIIPVQPNWTDKSDLLGYYNPLDKNYISTPFLDALIKFCRQAINQRDKLFIICLDEMNLAHVEYYFAEFLSKLQDDREIELYSENLLRDMNDELKAYTGDSNNLASMTPAEREYYFKLKRMANMINKYPAKIKIPSNIKFIGTLNQDETTHDISPKVLDRSYVIRLENATPTEIASGDFTKPLRYQERTIFIYAYYKDIYSVDEAKLIAEMRQFAHISKCAEQEIINNFWIGDTDYIIASFLLPKIRFDNDADKINRLREFCKGHTLSEEIFNSVATDKSFDYWRRIY